MGSPASSPTRAIATLYGNLERLISAPTLKLGRSKLESRQGPLTGGPQSFGVGFELQTERHPFGPALDGFGHSGGSIHGCWPAGVGFSYAMNLAQVGAEVFTTGQLLDALRERRFGES